MRTELNETLEQQLEMDAADDLYEQLDADEITKRATDDFVRMVPATPQTLMECALSCGFEDSLEYVEMAGLHTVDEFLDKIEYVMSGIGWESNWDINDSPLRCGYDIEWADEQLYVYSTFVQCDRYIDFVTVPMHKAADGSYWMNSGLTS